MEGPAPARLARRMIHVRCANHERLVLARLAAVGELGAAGEDVIDACGEGSLGGQEQAQAARLLDSPHTAEKLRRLAVGVGLGGIGDASTASFQSGVQMLPGETELTRTSWTASSMASALEKAVMAPLVAP